MPDETYNRDMAFFSLQVYANNTSKSTFVREDKTSIRLQSYIPKAMFGGSSPDYQLMTGHFDKERKSLKITASRKNYSWQSYEKYVDLSLQCQ